MTVPMVVILWAALALFVVIIIIAATHVVFGVRFANRDRHILVATLAFLVAFVLITGVTALLVRNVVWSGSWEWNLPFMSTGGQL